MHVRFRTTLFVALSGAIAVSPLQAEEEHREHGAHVHGHGTLNVVRDGGELEIELISPAANLLGFEHGPRSDAEREALKMTVAQLRRGAELFELPAAAHCRQEGVEIHSALLGEHGADDDHNHDHEQNDEHEADTHTDFEIHYAFHCDSPAQLDRVTLRLFDRFPATEELAVQLVTPTGQRRAELTARDNTLTF